MRPRLRPGLPLPISVPVLRMLTLFRPRRRKTQGQAASSSRFSSPLLHRLPGRQTCRTRRAPIPPRLRLIRRPPLSLPPRHRRQQVRRSNYGARALAISSLPHRALETMLEATPAWVSGAPQSLNLRVGIKSPRSPVPPGRPGTAAPAADRSPWPDHRAAGCRSAD